jgi:hypothetical protein
MPATGTSMTHTMMAARTVATTVSARVRMRAAAAALSRGMLESVLLTSLPDRAEDGSRFCLAMSPWSSPATLVSSRCQNEVHAFEHRYDPI